MVQRQTVTVKTVRKRSPEAMETLRGALEATDWNALFEPHDEDIDGVTDCVSEYINFCMDTVTPSPVPSHPAATQKANPEEEEGL